MWSTGRHTSGTEKEWVSNCKSVSVTGFDIGCISRDGAEDANLGAGVMPALVVVAMVSTPPRGAQGDLATCNTNSFHDVTTTYRSFCFCS